MAYAQRNMAGRRSRRGQAFPPARDPKMLGATKDQLVTLARQGHQWATEELRRRGRDIDGVKLAWKQAKKNPLTSHRYIVEVGPRLPGVYSHTYVDGNGNQIIVRPVYDRYATFDNVNYHPVEAAYLCGRYGRGYLVAVTPDACGWWDESCPSSYGRPCLGWFGPGERLEDDFRAIEALTTRMLPRNAKVTSYLGAS